jgi:hypothetical protein
MTAILKAGDLTPDELRLLLETCKPPDQEPRLWLEGPDGWALDWWRGLARNLRWCGANRPPEEHPLADLLPRAWAGRLFAPSGELRWRVLPVLGKHCVRTVFLGNQSWESSEGLRERPEGLRGLERREESALLWGQMTERTPDEWIELRIPHRFRYPVTAQTPSAGRVGVKARLEVWEDGRGEPHFVRLCDLESYWEK